jgi:hypothetical protein
MTGKYAELNPHGPRLRTVLAHILTEAGWVQGTFLVPEGQSLMDFFSGGVQLLKLTRARFPGEKELIPFIALRREAIHVVEPAAGEDQIEAPGGIGRTTPHEVSAFLLAGQLHGTLEVLVNVRLSDFLRQQSNLLVLRDCRLVPYGEAKDSPKVRKLRVVLLNMARVLGFGELDNSAQRDAR